MAAKNMYTAAFLVIAAAIAAATPVPFDTDFGHLPALGEADNNNNAAADASGVSSPIWAPAGEVVPGVVSDDRQQCTIRDPAKFLDQFEQGPNSCVTDNSESIILSRILFNLKRTNPLPIDNAQDTIFQYGPARPFIFASGDGGCVDEWLQAGVGNTPAQYETILDIGYSAKDRCDSVRPAQNATLLVWESQPSDAVLATWDNVVPYMANLYGIANPAVTAETMKSTDFATFAQNPQYAVEKQLVGQKYCASAYDGTYMRDAMTMDPSGLKFRAALEQCYSFFDIYQGTGYTINPVSGEASKCKEFLYPNKYFKDFAQDDIVAIDLQLGVNYEPAEIDSMCTW